jgi:erythrin-vacuolar iron transport family protein
MSLYSGLTVIEILGIAVKKEVEAASFYKKLAGKIGNPIIRERFMTLSKEEQKHRALLSAEYKRFTGEEKVPLPKGKFSRREAFDMEEASIEDALEYAIAAERDAQKLYSAASKASSDPRGQSMLDYLVEFEKGHERQLKADLDFYRKDPGWFEGQDDYFHVGP